VAVRLSSVFHCIQLSGGKKEAIVVAKSTYLLLHNEIGKKDVPRYFETSVYASTKLHGVTCDMIINWISSGVP
jgi:hypothetical protein